MWTEEEGAFLNQEMTRVMNLIKEKLLKMARRNSKKTGLGS